ncbi:hypothetical protein D4R89_13415 [bacterium]|nr:MAG: hypothetical protein D4R89_13415 [bacterium]
MKRRQKSIRICFFALHDLRSHYAGNRRSLSRKKIIPDADRVKNKKFTPKEAGGPAQRAGRLQMRLKDN